MDLRGIGVFAAILMLSCAACVAGAVPGNQPDGTAKATQVSNTKYAKGERLFLENCAACHLHKGRVGPPLIQDTGYFVRAGVPGEMMGALLQVPVRKKREDSPMPQFTPEMVSDDDLNQIGLYIASFTEKPKDVPALGNPRMGKEVYDDKCSMCHGDNGEGTQLGMPLAMLSGDLKKAGAPPNVIYGFTSMAVRSGSVKGMVEYDEEDVSDKDLADLAAYIWTFEPPK